MNQYVLESVFECVSELLQVTSNRTAQREREESIKLARTIAIIFLVFFFCWAPYTAISVRESWFGSGISTCVSWCHFGNPFQQHSNSLFWPVATRENNMPVYLVLIGRGKLSEKNIRVCSWNPTLFIAWLSPGPKMWKQRQKLRQRSEKFSCFHNSTRISLLQLGDRADKLPLSVHLWSLTFAHANSSFNSVVYATTNRQFR